MKKLITTAVFLLFAFIPESMAGQADLFKYDAVAIENQMAQMDLLEEYVLLNPDMTSGQLEALGNLPAGVSAGPFRWFGSNQVNDRVLGIPGFLWGCTIGWVGILIVYLNGNDPYEIKQATIGCITGGIVLGGCYLVYVAGLLAVLSSYGWY